MSIRSLIGSRNFCNIICLRNAWRSPNECVGFERENWPPSSKIMATESWYFTFSVVWLDKFVQQEIKQRHSHSLCETGSIKRDYRIPVAIHDVPGVTGVTVICVSPWYVYPRTHIPSDMCIPGGDTINTDAHPRHNKEISSLAKGNVVDII